MKNFIALLSTVFLLVGTGEAKSAPSAAQGVKQQREKIAAQGSDSAGIIQGALEEYLASQMPEIVTEWKITKITRNENEKIPADYDGREVKQIKSTPNGDMRTMAVEFLKNDKVIKKLTLTCKLEMHASAVVAKESVPRGATITENMVEVASVLVDAPLSEITAETSDVVGRSAERSIQAGKMVRKSHLNKVMDVKTGDLVVIVAKSDAVQLTARGIAKKDGMTGEMIPVVNLRSNKKLFAKIVESGTVEVAF
jgi:flagella basal body P-ring formation protein FlgA